MQRREAGFTLLEVLVALAIAVLLGGLLLRTSISALHWTALQSQRVHEHAQIGELVDRLESEEDSAWAIFTPYADGHEVDFFTRDGQNQPYFWAYTYDADAQTLTRSIYSTLGGARLTDIIYTGITAFYAHTYPLTALQDPSSKIYSPLYAGATLTPGSVAFFPGSEVAGGNQITYVRIDGPTLARELQLSTQTAPSGFTVVLQYTPAPTATPKPALKAWPAFVELPIQGQALQTAALPPPHDIAFYLNRLFGGGIANAALAPCETNQARAFSDGPPNWAVPLANASAPAGALPAGVTGTTDANGCITFSSSAFTSGMPNVALYEPGYTGTVKQYGSSCGPGVSIVATYPGSQQGPDVQLDSVGGSPIDPCGITWQDAQTTSTTATTTYRVVGCASNQSRGIVPVGSNCVVTAAPWPNDSPNCVPPNNDPGGIQNGYNGSGIYSMQGYSGGTSARGVVTSNAYGSIATNADGSVTFTRTAPGAETITAYGVYLSFSYVNRNGRYSCVTKSSYNALSSWIIN